MNVLIKIFKILTALTLAFFWYIDLTLAEHFQNGFINIVSKVVKKVVNLNF